MITPQWTYLADASCWHAVLSAAAGRRFVDEGLGGALRRLTGPAVRPQRDGGAWPGDHPIADDPGRAAERHSRACLLAGGPARCEEQLRLRTGPLRELWGARGPGLMNQVGKLTASAPPLAARVYPVVPVCGGGGLAFPEARAATIEAVLTNPVETLPEVLRLGWLLTRLGAPHASSGSAAAAACAVLAAAERVELATLDGASLKLACESWGISAAPATDAMLDWWADYRRSPIPWVTAVGRLGSAGCGVDGSGLGRG